MATVDRKANELGIAGPTHPGTCFSGHSGPGNGRRIFKAHQHGGAEFEAVDRSNGTPFTWRLAEGGRQNKSDTRQGHDRTNESA